MSICRRSSSVPFASNATATTEARRGSGPRSSWTSNGGRFLVSMSLLSRKNSTRATFGPTIAVKRWTPVTPSPSGPWSESVGSFASATRATASAAFASGVGIAVRFGIGTSKSSSRTAPSFEFESCSRSRRWYFPGCSSRSITTGKVVAPAVGKVNA